MYFFSRHQINYLKTLISYILLESFPRKHSWWPLYLYITASGRLVTASSYQLVSFHIRRFLSFMCGEIDRADLNRWDNPYALQLQWTHSSDHLSTTVTEGKKTIYESHRDSQTHLWGLEGMWGFFFLCVWREHKTECVPVNCTSL